VTIWLDNQLPPALGSWVREHLGLECTSVRELALQRASDLDIFHAARAAGALVMTKDADFAELVGRFGPPPQVVLVTCGERSSPSGPGVGMADGREDAAWRRTVGGGRRQASF
jgi:predicted nuclease of predicted toxin-antitoxin system